MNESVRNSSRWFLKGRRENHSQRAVLYSSVDYVQQLGTFKRTSLIEYSINFFSIRRWLVALLFHLATVARRWTSNHLDKLRNKFTNLGALR